MDEDCIESIAADGVVLSSVLECNAKRALSHTRWWCWLSVQLPSSNSAGVLAAFRTSKLTEVEQNAVAEELLKSSPPTMVFLSGLLIERNKPILSVLCEQLIRSLGDENVKITLSNKVDDVTSYPVLLQNLLKCHLKHNHNLSASM